ncbi:S9 family peptidase [Mechercharimyces sp. CAU 1602]|uniref:alpha/beta hydrolase family protein n=1 Tax=Mechercharimyces sp. CAU 1602 TaxID=2973933 RepID=UPI0021635291|nr:alpha/beta hydrolase [Mechercharimyces sp. CAU 1602]MCS1351977.1 alpha/beta hydrolase [Mechercharimyces sp. CAU 1602]
MPIPFTIPVGTEERLIRGDLFLPESNGRVPVIIICHGFKGFKDWGFFPYAAESLASSRFAVITFNFSMNGVGEDLLNFTQLDRFARNTFSREQEDLQILLQTLHAGTLPESERLNLAQCGLIGHSRGGGNALLFALNHDSIRAVTTWNSIAQLDLFPPALKEEIYRNGVGTIYNARTKQDMPIDLEVLKDLDYNKKSFDLLSRLPSYPHPLLFIHGEDDTSVPATAARQLYNVSPHASLHMIAGADHVFGCSHPFQGSTPMLEEAIAETASFMKKQLTSI